MVEFHSRIPVLSVWIHPIPRCLRCAFDRWQQLPTWTSCHPQASQYPSTYSTSLSDCVCLYFTPRKLASPLQRGHSKTGCFLSEALMYTSLTINQLLLLSCVFNTLHLFSLLATAGAFTIDLAQTVQIKLWIRLWFLWLVHQIPVRILIVIFYPLDLHLITTSVPSITTLKWVSFFPHTWHSKRKSSPSTGSATSLSPV